MNGRIVIDSWDWHYRVGFDQALAGRIKSNAKELKSEMEQRILLQQLDIFSSMVSISALCDTLDENPERFQELLDGVERSRLLHVPSYVAKVLQSRIEQLPERLEPAKKDLAALLSSATNSPFINYHAEIFEPVFGSELKSLVCKSLSRLPPAPKDQSIDRHDLKATVDHILKILMAGSHVNTVLGDVIIPNFETILKEGTGFAEYWPVELSGSTSNQLIVFDNPDQLRVGTLQTTLAHEVLGHSVFYEAEVSYAPPFFDHGAICLVEGWATWCEWNASATPHGDFSRAARLYGLRHFYENDVDKLRRSISYDIHSLGYSDAIVSSTMMYFFQYPGYSLSYTLGALWFEDRFRDVRPDNFFASLKERPWGDFFQLW